MKIRPKTAHSCGSEASEKVRPLADLIAKLPEPFESGGFDMEFVDAHFFGGLGFFVLGSFFNSKAAFSKSKSTACGCESRNAR